MGVLAIVGWVLLGLVALIVLLLAIPVELALRVEHAEATRAELELGLFAGRWPLAFQLPPGPADAEEPAPPPEPEPESEPTEEVPGPSAMDRAEQGLALVRSEGFLARTWQLLVDVVTSFSVRHLSLWLTLGTGDPADTGELYGRIQATMPATYAIRRFDVHVTPDFDRTVFEGGGELRLRATPLRLVWLSLAYALSPTTLRAVHAAWRARPDA